MGSDLSCTKGVPWVAYVGPVPFPEGGAAARRILGNARSLVHSGFDVTIVSGQVGNSSAIPFQVAEGISLVSVGERVAEHWPRALRRLRYATMGMATRHWLKTRDPPPAAVILYSGYTPYLLQLLPWCRRHGIPLIFDAVEWYEARSRFHAAISPYQWNIEFAMRCLIKRADGVIAISDYLARYYIGAGKAVLKVPPTLLPEGVPSRINGTHKDVVDLCYAGNPGAGKDLIDVVISAIGELDGPSRGRVRLHIAGLTEAELLRLPSMDKKKERFPEWIVFHGRLPHEETLSLIRSCDYSVLLRGESRVSRAGFSTKFVESLACGTPVLGNITGDLGAYLKDGRTGYVSDGWTVSAFKKTLERAVATPHVKLTQMRKSCIETAGHHFDALKYSEPLASLIALAARVPRERGKGRTEKIRSGE